MSSTCYQVDDHETSDPPAVGTSATFWTRVSPLPPIRRIAAPTGGQASIIKHTAAGWVATLYQDTSTTAKGYSAALAPDGQIWMAFASGIRAYDPATGMVTPVAYASVPQGLSVIDGQIWIIRADRVTLDRVSLTGAVQQTITLPAGTTAHGHWLELAR